jgi:Uma2 family endonuclease
VLSQPRKFLNPPNASFAITLPCGTILEMNALTATFRFTVEDYYRLYEVGILDDKDRIELLNGDLNLMQAIGSRHAQTLDNLNFELGASARRRFMVSLQNPVKLDQFSAPQPDLKLIPVNHRRKGHPKSEDVFLVIEISDSSLRYDREVKLPAYARSGIAEYWIINLIDDVVELFRHPQGESYLDSATYGMDSTISPLAFSDVILKVADIIPER